jgi:hypothetical protein
MKRHVDRMRVAEITHLLAHVSGILDALPLTEYAEAIEGEASAAAGQHGDDTTEASFRRARRIELVAAAGHAQEFVSCIQAAMAHFRAARRAAVLEYAAAEEERPTVRAFNEAHAAALRRAHPNSNVVPMHRPEEALPDEPA